MAGTDPGSTGGIVDNAAAGRFELPAGAGAAFLEYERDDDTLVLIHTEVPPAERGRGTGSRLVAGVLDHARAAGLRVVPRCRFVKAWLRRHPEHEDLIA